LPCVAVCCCVLQCVTVCCSMLQQFHRQMDLRGKCHTYCYVAVCCSVLQCVGVCCSNLTGRWTSEASVTRTVMLQYVAVCCSVLQYVAAISPADGPQRQESRVPCVWGLPYTCARTRDVMRTLLRMHGSWHTFVRVTWLIHMCDMTHSYVWHDSLICVTWLFHTCDTTYSYTCARTRDVVQTLSRINGSCHVWMSHVTREVVMSHTNVSINESCQITHSHIWHDPFTYVTWLIYMCDMTHLHVRHDSFTCVTRLFHMCDKTHSHK